ncbi:MAG: hypothetical protein O7B27_12540 [Gammaproteobacteria bacterium]|nr:hypothetical protein [Gammaproteobacteria bacterium]
MSCSLSFNPSRGWLRTFGNPVCDKLPNGQSLANLEKLLVEFLIGLFQDYPEAVSLLGAFLAGSVFILLLSILASQVDVSIHLIFFFAFLGNLASDFLWFKFGWWIRRKSWMNFLRDHPNVQDRIDRFNQKHSPQHAFYFVGIKFIYGIRILAIISLGVVRYATHRFLIYDSFAVAIINFFICYAGWMYATGVTQYLTAFDYTVQLMTLLFFGLLGLLGLRKLGQKLFLD